jgi:hypothetical protein
MIHAANIRKKGGDKKQKQVDTWEVRKWIIENKWRNQDIGHSNKGGSLSGHQNGVLGTLLHAHGLGFQRAGH